MTETDELGAYSDGDWAGRSRTRKSTSGGVLMDGPHLVRHQASTQWVVALSSAEDELHAFAKSMAEILGLMNMMKQFWKRSAR